MPVTIDWATKIISVTQSYLTNLGGGIYELDLDEFRLDLKDLEDDEVGMPFDDTHRHNTEVLLSGVTYARVFEIINGYTVTFENLQYAVNAVGANSNLADVMNVNQVSLRSFNAAGLISVVSGSGVTQQDKDDITFGVWEEAQVDHTSSGSMGEAVRDIEAMGLRALGLAQENFRVRDQVYDAYGGAERLISSTIRLYGNGTDAENDANHTEEYEMEAEYDTDGNCTSYFVKKI